jgi:GT2 family glycosyltransferase
MKGSIIIITWNQEALLQRCLSALFRYVDRSNVEVIVVDNGSKDNTVDMIRSMFPDVNLFLNSKNVGVARARNKGISASRGEYIVLLDDDTECSNDFVSKGIEYMKLHPEIGILGPSLYSENGELQPSARSFPTVRGILGRGLPRITPDTFRLEYLYKFINSTNPIEVGWVLGACQFIRKEAIQEIGLLDSKYFFGYEDIDFCRQASQKKWKVFYHPGIKLVHKYQRKSAKSLFSKIKYYHIKSIIRYYYKYGVSW